MVLLLCGLHPSLHAEGLITLLHVIKEYSFDKTAKDLLVLVDQVLFARWPRSYVPYHSFSLFSAIITVE
jgi:hypothetical protein